MMWRVFPCLAAAFLAMAEPVSEGQSWWNHVQYLADDKLEGREAGSPGHRAAADYIAAQFKAAGLQPGGVNGYFQPVKLRTRQIVEEQSSLELVVNGKARPVKLGEEAYFSLRSEPDKVVEAPAVFIGHGLQIPEMKIDDLAGIDLTGKIVVYLSGAPKSVPGPLAAHYQSSAERWKRLRAAGAIGTISFTNPKHSEMPWERSAPARLLPAMSLADPKLVDTAGQRVAIAFRTERADLLFDGSGHTVAEILSADDSGRQLPKFPLKITVRAKPVFRASETVSENVVAIAPGTDPRLRNQYVVLSAHMDHVGKGKAVEGDSVYNGAMDNASGVATLIELGKRLMSERRHKRSVILLAVTAEEKGLLGSRYYADRPTVPIKSIVANLNVDMFLPIIPLQAITVYGLDESDLGPQFTTLAQAAGVNAVRDHEPERNLFVRSDQYNFIRRGVPALAFKITAPAGSDGDKKMREWISTRYHGLTDDLKQPVDLEAAAKFNVLFYAMAVEVANRAARPQWKSDSFFRRFAAQG